MRHERLPVCAPPPRSLFRWIATSSRSSRIGWISMPNPPRIPPCFGVMRTPRGVIAGGLHD